MSTEVAIIKTTHQLVRLSVGNESTLLDKGEALEVASQVLACVKEARFKDEFELATTIATGFEVAEKS